MAVAIYSLCAATAILCAVLLLSSYRRTRLPLLFWSGLCFAGLALNNILLVADRVVFPAIDLSVWRSSVALSAMIVLLYGLVWHNE